MWMIIDGNKDEKHKKKKKKKKRRNKYEKNM